MKSDMHTWKGVENDDDKQTSHTPNEKYSKKHKPEDLTATAKEEIKDEKKRLKYVEPNQQEIQK